MTLVNQNSISGINSITAESSTLSFHDNGGVERVRINSGDVGIGTDNPDVALHILSNTTGFKVQRDNEFLSINPNYAGQSHCAFELTSALSIRTGSGSQNERLRIDSSGNIGINSTSPKTDLDISQKTGAIALPQGTTAQRPTGDNPYIRYNTTNSALEFYNGTNWVELITDYFPTGSVILG